VDDFDDLLARLNALDDFLPERFLLNAFNKIAGHLEIHVCFKQRHPDLAQGISDIGLGNLAEAAQVPKDILQFAG
jgi:hypothetical protein